jgi:hypothetical protein
MAPEIAEALAMRRAIMLARDEGFSKIIVNFDCFSIVQHVTVGQEDRSLCGPMIHDIRQMAASFVSCSFVYVMRGLNIVVLNLAKFSECFICSVCTVGLLRIVSVRDCIRETPCNDIMVI